MSHLYQRNAFAVNNNRWMHQQLGKNSNMSSARSELRERRKVKNSVTQPLAIQKQRLPADSVLTTFLSG
jgi:hypothetical protein